MACMGTEHKPCCYQHQALTNCFRWWDWLASSGVYLPLPHQSPQLRIPPSSFGSVFTGQPWVRNLTMSAKKSCSRREERCTEQGQIWNEVKLSLLQTNSSCYVSSSTFKAYRFPCGIPTLTAGKFNPVDHDHMLITCLMLLVNIFYSFISH